MSLTMQQIIIDAKRLTERLKERDSVTDVLLNETHAINKKIESMKQYQEEVEQLNDVAHQKPHSQLIANIQKENRHLREIQQENRELRAALEEHQTALEHIMTKYRIHTTEQIFNSRIDFLAVRDNKYHEVVTRQAERIQEMIAVMHNAALIDENNSNKDSEVMTQLKIENEGLKEILEISCKFGSFNKSLKAPLTEDKLVQTDSSLL